MTTAADWQTVYLPLIFFFNRNPGLYLPLIALQYHEVRIDFDLAVRTSPPTSHRHRLQGVGQLHLPGHRGASPLRAEGSRVPHRAGAAHWLRHRDLPLPPSRSASPTTTQSRSLCGASPTPRPRTPCGTSPPRPLMPGRPRVQPDVRSRTSNCFVPTALGVSPLVAGRLVVVTPPSLRRPLVPSTFKLILNGQDRFKEQKGKYFNQVQPTTTTLAAPTPVSTRTLSRSSQRSTSQLVPATSRASTTRRSGHPTPPTMRPPCTCSRPTTTSSASNRVWVASPSPTKQTRVHRGGWTPRSLTGSKVPCRSWFHVVDLKGGEGCW
jgi:hypothetical protein